MKTIYVFIAKNLFFFFNDILFERKFTFQFFLIEIAQEWFATDANIDAEVFPFSFFSCLHWTSAQ